MDFDLNSGFIDNIDFVESERTGIVTNQLVDPSVVAGVKLLSDIGGDFSYTSLSRNADLATMTTAQKWTYLNSGIQKTEIENVDVVMLISTSASDFNPGESKDFGFSIWVASNSEEAETVYLESQRLWDNDLAASSIPEDNELISPHPNPFLGTINFNYTVASQGLVELAIFDVLGRKVKSLVRSIKGIGEYDIRWDGRSNNGELAPAGLYFAQLLIDDVEVGPVKSIHKIN